jgi:hypothetical protein
MPIEIVVYRGWVGGREIDRIELEMMGVQILSDWNPIGAFDRVQMTRDVYKVFCQRWEGRYVWGLVQRKELVRTAAERAAEEEDIPF